MKPTYTAKEIEMLEANNREQDIKTYFTIILNKQDASIHIPVPEIGLRWQIISRIPPDGCYDFNTFQEVYDWCMSVDDSLSTAVSLEKIRVDLNEI